MNGFFKNQFRTIVSSCYDGKKRALYLTRCRRCGRFYFVPWHVLKKTKYCSHTCSDPASRRRVKLVCAYCHKKFERKPSGLVKSKSGLYFCNRNCKDQAQQLGGIAAIQPSHYGNGANSYRKRALKAKGKKCERCGYSGSKKMLDVHHRDGNRGNGRLSNLEILCVWCHWLETRKVKPIHPWDGGLKKTGR